MSKIEYQFKIGEKSYSLLLDAENENDGTQIINADDLLNKQWQLGEKLVSENYDAEKITCEMFNFLVDISGLSNSELAAFVGIEQSNVSQWRRNKGISKAAWQAFRVLFYDLFSSGKISHPIFLGNKERVAG